MKRIVLLGLPVWLAFCLLLGVQDAFSRGGARGGNFGGSYRGSASYGSGAAMRSPSMSSYSHSRPAVSQSRPRPSSNVATGQQRPSTTSRAVSQRPSTSGQRVSQGTGSRVESRPGVATRPTQGQMQQFLNLPQQGGRGLSDAGKVGVGLAAGALGYEGARQLLESHGYSGIGPGAGERPSAGERPGAGERRQASTLPAERPGAGQRPGLADRPGAGERPSQLPSRPNAGQIRENFQNRHDNIFTPQWWKDHPNAAKAYWHNFGRYQYAWNHWWRPATWGALGAWVAGAPWDSPTYYDYGEGIYYDGDQVYSNGTPVASAEEYYQQASDLATSAPPAQASETDWLPLGIFAISSDQATDSNTLLQLAVSKDGVIAGTYYNTATDIGRPVKGMVDKKTQRAAWTFSDGKNTDILMETGIFNLTQDQTEALVHFGKEKTQQVLMVRLNEPKKDETAKQE
jgi:hypothetical protein